ncbi:septum-promoting GTP-binding protein 1 [Delphinella strobiligena]|nr:septum-promoting GTP-binding protein 1 [Delphinella strobiligena]
MDTYDAQAEAGAKHDPSLEDASVQTITASSVNALPNVEVQSNHSNSQYGERPQTSYSDTGFTRSAYASYSADNTPDRPLQNFSPSAAVDDRHRYADQQNPSRPSSRLSRQNSDYDAQQSQQAAQRQQAQKNASVVIKVGMVGDAQIGKTSLMVKYVEGSWDEDYIQTLGVNFMEKTISIRNTEITFSIWDLGGQREFVNMLPLVCNDAVAILFMFDLTRKSTLNSIKEWYRQGRGFNKTAIPFLVGTKYDHFVNFPKEEQEEISMQAKRFAKAMKASLIFSSTSHSINVQKIFKIVLSKAFDLRCTIPEIEHVGEPLLLYQSV